METSLWAWVTGTQEVKGQGHWERKRRPKTCPVNIFIYIPHVSSSTFHQRKRQIVSIFVRLSVRHTTFITQRLNNEHLRKSRMRKRWINFALKRSRSLWKCWNRSWHSYVTVKLKPSVCLSVRLSATFRYSVTTVKHTTNRASFTSATAKTIFSYFATSVLFHVDSFIIVLLKSYHELSKSINARLELFLKVVIVNHDICVLRVCFQGWLKRYFSIITVFIMWFNKLSSCTVALLAAFVERIKVRNNYKVHSGTNKEPSCR